MIATESKMNVEDEELSSTTPLLTSVDMSVTGKSNNDNYDEDDMALISNAQNTINNIPIKSNMENDIFFADPYYDLFPHKIHSSVRTKSSASINDKVKQEINKDNDDASDISSDNNEKEMMGVEQAKDAEKETQHHETTLTAKGIQRAAHLPIVTAFNPLTSHNDRLSHALSSIYPFLQSSPSHSDAIDGVGFSESGNYRSNSKPYEPECMFASSTLVPRSVKPPSAGVITDRNLYKGQFAFWGYTLAERVALAKVQQEEKEQQEKEEQQEKMTNKNIVQENEQHEESKVEKLQGKDNVKSLLNILKDEAACNTLEQESDANITHSLPSISCQSEEEIDKALKFFVKVSKARRTAQSKYFNIRALRIVANYSR